MRTWRVYEVYMLLDARDRGARAWRLGGLLAALGLAVLTA